MWQIVLCMAELMLCAFIGGSCVGAWQFLAHSMHNAVWPIFVVVVKVLEQGSWLTMPKQ